MYIVSCNLHVSGMLHNTRVGYNTRVFQYTFNSISVWSIKCLCEVELYVLESIKL
jgi:hypothetical protein